VTLTGCQIAGAGHGDGAVQKGPPPRDAAAIGPLTNKTGVSLEQRQPLPSDYVVVRHLGKGTYGSRQVDPPSRRRDVLLVKNRHDGELLVVKRIARPQTLPHHVDKYVILSNSP
jgi:hypothetical protein